MGEAVSYGRRLSNMAAADPDGTAFVFAPTEGADVRVTWTELDRRSNQVARLLAERGVGVNDVVVVGLKNSVEHFFTTFGTWKVGGCVVPLRWDLPTWERERLLEVAAPTAVVAEWDDSERPVVRLADVRASTSLSDAPLPDVTPPRANGIASSGSTGRPKIIINPLPGEFVEEDEKPMTGIAAAVQLVPTTLYHTNGFATYTYMMRGESLVVMERFDAARFVDLVEQYRVNAFIAVPTMLQRIARLPGVTERDWSSIQAVQYGGASIPDWLVRFWIDLVGPERFFLSYGSTERVGLCIARGDEWLAHPGTSGRGYDGTEVRILDADGKVLPPGEVGEIFMRQPKALEGPTFEYVGASPPPKTEDGFTSIGDLGWLDDDGYLYIADRRVDMIVTGGANVYPAEVEAALTEHPAVGDVCVVGLPDPEWGRRVHAVVEPADRAHPPSVEDLDAHARERLAAYKRPKTYELVDHLPRSDAGKINRGRVMAERESTESAETPTGG
jgi:bile acid-coenzyme A ligase